MIVYKNQKNKALFFNSSYFRKLKVNKNIFLKRPLNIALLAHVDAGKTSITEQLLYHCGEIKKLGLVDKGTSASDVMLVEKERGISVMASHMSLNYKGVHINILDTPGHADFISEVERSLLAVDLVVLVLSAYEGVQAQTRNIWTLLQKLKLPTIFLINKIDKSDFDPDFLIQNIHQELTFNALPAQVLNMEPNMKINFIWSDDPFKGSLVYENLIEKLSEYDDRLLEQYLAEEQIDRGILKEVYLKSIVHSKVYPVLFSSAKMGLGIEALLMELEAFYSMMNFEEASDLSAIVFKISQHPQFGKLAHLRLFAGSLKKKQLVYNQRLGEEEKVNQIKTVFSQKLTDLEEAGPGDIIAVSGFGHIALGDVLGRDELSRKWSFNTVPILKVQVKPIHSVDYVKLSEALMQLNQEDPLLDFQWFKESEEFHMKINGQIQVEILEQILMERFQIEAHFEDPSVIYKETPSQTAYGFDAYTMPKPCWAVLKFKLEPGDPGSGVEYASEVGVNDILIRYQREVERTIPKALEQGIKAWEVTDIKITLVEGEDHVVHSRAGDFGVATPMAIMNGLQKAGTTLLEPIMKFIIEAPEEYMGGITSDIILMRGSFEQPEIEEGKMKLSGYLPVATSMDYPVKLAAKTGGQGVLSLSFDRYDKIDEDLGVVREFKGISPLDRSKYILKARKAIQ